MTRGEFLNEMRRLTNGFGRPASDLTEERVTALYEHFSHAQLDAWRAAVSRMLLGGRYPSVGEMETAVEKAIEHVRLNRTGERDREAKRFFENPPSLPRSVEREFLENAGSPLFVQAIRSFYDSVESGVPAREAAELFKAIDDQCPKDSCLMFYDFARAYGHLPFRIGKEDHERRRAELAARVAKSQEVGL